MMNRWLKLSCGFLACLSLVACSNSGDDDDDIISEPTPSTSSTAQTINTAAAVVLPKTGYGYNKDGFGQEGEPPIAESSPEYKATKNNGCDWGLKVENGKCVNKDRRQAEIDTFQTSWTAKALTLQREFSKNHPLNRIHILAAHNTYNSPVEGNNASFVNQTYSITDQLRQGVREILPDLHWVNNDLRLCHGAKIGTILHAGCNDTNRPWRYGVEEINNWLRLPENKNEILLIEIESIAEGHTEDVIAPVKDYLSDLVFKPADKTKGKWPTPAEMVAMGKRVILNTDGGKEAASDYVDEWIFRLRVTDDYDFVTPAFPANKVKNLTAYPECGKIAMKDTQLVNFYGDDLVIPGVTNGPKDTGQITPANISQLFECGVNLIGMDTVRPDLVKASVWSWAENQPDNQGGNEQCAYQLNGRWYDGVCSLSYLHACQSTTDVNDWKLSSSKGAWSASVCPSGYAFAMPVNGFQNKKLKDLAGSNEVWLNYTNNNADKTWK